MKFEDVLDTRELASLALEAVEVGKRILGDYGAVSSEEISDANHTLASMRYALRDLGFNDVPYEEMPDRWMQISDEEGTRLVKDSSLADELKSSLLDAGIITPTALTTFEGAVDWEQVAHNQNITKVNFNHASSSTPNFYWLF